MRFRDVGLSLVGSAVVYVAMAACSSGGGSSGAISTKGFGTGGGSHLAGSTGATASSGGVSGAGGVGGVGGAGGSSGAGLRDSGIFDALTDPVATASADPTSGTRLKATYRTGSDGSKEYINGVWFDSQRNETCSFALAADGQERCLPEGIQGGIFSDAQCTIPIVSVTTGCTAPAYAVTDSTTACSAAAGGVQVYSVGAATSPSTIYVQSGGMCFSAGSGTAGFDYYTVGTTVAPSSFVAATGGHD